MTKYENVIAGTKEDGMPIKIPNPDHFTLRPLGKRDIESKALIRNLGLWRAKNSRWFPSKFKVTSARTKKWLDELVVNNTDRILFIIEDEKNKQYGHLGFYRYDQSNNSCELDNVVRGVVDVAGLMTKCVNALVAWGFANLGIDHIYLTTFEDNEKALKLYRRCGFKIYKRVGLVKKKKGNEYVWEKAKNQKSSKFARYEIKMVQTKP